MFVSYFNNLGSHVICAPLSGVLVGTISLYVVQHVSQVLVNMRSPYRLTGRSICWSTLNWYVRQYIGQHSTASPPTSQLICHPIHDQYIYRSTLGRYGECQSSVEYWSTVSGILIDYWWHIGLLSYNIICVLKSAGFQCCVWDITVRGFENSLSSIVCVIPHQPCQVNLLISAVILDMF